MTEAQNDYDTFPYDSFVEDSIEIDLEEEIEERNSEIEIAETETELTETETGKAKSYQFDIWTYFERKSVEEENNIKNYIMQIY